MNFVDRRRAIIFDITRIDIEKYKGLLMFTMKTTKDLTRIRCAARRSVEVRNAGNEKRTWTPPPHFQGLASGVTVT